MRRIISPWEYRHLRVFGGLHIAGAVLLVGLGLTTLTFGGSNWTAYGFALGFCGLGVAHLAVGYWELTIADSEAESERSSGARPDAPRA